MKTSLRFASFFALALGIGALPQPVQAANEGNPDNLCRVSFWEPNAVASVCIPGEKIIFLPDSFGNEQLPVLFAAANCDLHYAVVSTTGAVTCVYRPIKSSHSDQDDANSKEKK